MVSGRPTDGKTDKPWFLVVFLIQPGYIFCSWTFCSYILIINSPFAWFNWSGFLFLATTLSLNMRALWKVPSWQINRLQSPVACSWSDHFSLRPSWRGLMYSHGKGKSFAFVASLWSVLWGPIRGFQKGTSLIPPERDFTHTSMAVSAQHFPLGLLAYFRASTPLFTLRSVLWSDSISGSKSSSSSSIWIQG